MERPMDEGENVQEVWPLIDVLQTYDPNTGSNGNLRQVIMTRLSACLCYQNGNKVFVAYEPTISNSYLQYMFKQGELPKKTFKMQALKLPSDFETLMNTLEINQKKVDKISEPEDNKKPA